MGTGFLLVGFLFLLNPDFYTLDFLPDVFGYLLISLGLKKLSFLEDRLATARRFFHYLALVSVAKILSVPSVLTTTMENTRLTVSFLFFLVEAWLLYVAVNNSFKGIQYLAIRKDGNLCLKGYETASFFLTVFVFVKTVCAFLPASLPIFYPNIDADPEVAVVDRGTFMTVRNFLLAITWTIAIAFGIYTFLVLKAYVQRCRSDKVFCKNVFDDYHKKVKDNLAVQTILAVKSSFLLFLAAFVFLGDLYLDDVGLIPTFLSPLFVFLGLRRLKPYLEDKKFIFLPALAAALSFVTYVYRTVRLILADGYAPGFAIGVVKDTLLQALGLLSTILVAASFILALRAVLLVSKKFTTYSYKNYGFAVLILAVLCAGLGFFQFRAPSTYAVLPSIQWVLWVVGLYLHHKSMDDIRGETEYKLM